MKANLEKEKEDFIYHFTKSDTAIFHITPNQRLKFGKFENTNDPREYTSFGFGSINERIEFGEDGYLEKHIKQMEEITSELRSDCRVLAFCEDYFIDGSWWDGFNLPRMWAQYGENQKGICLKIDKSKFIEENPMIFKSDMTFTGEVDYTNKDEYPFINYDELEKDRLGYINGFIKANSKYLYFQKNKDWETEHEFRVVHFSKDKESFCSIKNSLVEIITGINFDREKLRVLAMLNPKTKISKAQYDNGIILNMRYREEFLESLKDGLKGT